MITFFPYLFEITVVLYLAGALASLLLQRNPKRCISITYGVAITAAGSGLGVETRLLLYGESSSSSQALFPLPLSRSFWIALPHSLSSLSPSSA